MVALRPKADTEALRMHDDNDYTDDDDGGDDDDGAVWNLNREPKLKL